MKHIAILSLLLAATAAHAQLDAIRTLTPTNSQATLRPIEAQVFAAPKAKLPALEKELLDIFQSSGTTLEGKQYACRMLRHCASEACVPVLAPQLTNPKLSSFVRLVFQGLETPAADKALAKALPKANNAIKVGIISTLGQRGSEKSVKAIKSYLKNNNTEIQLAAITALGNIGGKDATKALVRAKVNPKLSNDWKRAQLKCAGTLDVKTATRAYRKFLEEEHDDIIRAEALVGLVSLDPASSATEVLALLNSDNARLKKTATGLLAALPTAKLIESLAGMAPENQVLVISTLSDRKATEAEAIMLKLAASENESVRNAALLALGNVGRTASIQPLLAVTATNAPAFNALCALNAEGADVAIILSLENATDEPTIIKRLECLALRQTHAALPSTVKVAEGPWSRQTKIAIDTVGALVRTEDFPLFAQLMLSAKEPKKLQALEKSAAEASLRQTEVDPCALPLVKAFGNAKPESQYTLLRTLGRMGGEVARELLTQSVASSDPGTKDAAIRGLCNWPNIEVADQLLEQAQTAEIEKHRILALRGYIRLAGTVN
ncbi:MAG: HEAT repeat domain-containing protein, partial [Verrucomicrobia bacterium]|nr:HEAT repeat domain-containing protein [Verrucomicrobiota bacterium]